MAARGGTYRHRITIQQRIDVADEFGQPQPTWSTFKQVFAAVEPLNGRELFTANQVEGEVTVRIRMRYLAGVVPSMRVSWDGRLFNVKYVINVGERDKIMQLMCGEGLNDG